MIWDQQRLKEDGMVRGEKTVFKEGLYRRATNNNLEGVYPLSLLISNLPLQRLLYQHRRWDSSSLLVTGQKAYLEVFLAQDRL